MWQFVNNVEDLQPPMSAVRMGKTMLVARFSCGSSLQRMLLLTATVGFSLLALGCSDESGSVEVVLTPQAPDSSAGTGVRWSPKGEKLYLLEVNGGLETNLRLGPDGTAPLPLRLERLEARVFYSRLLIDRDRDGLFEGGDLLESEPEEIRGKVWSSFETAIDVPAVDPVTGSDVTNPYPLSFWFVDDPNVVEDELVIRFSRRGWMEGRATINGVDAVVLLTESVMNGVFDREDSWALASVDSSANVYSHEYARPVERHAWLLDEAYEITDLHPSGRRLILAPFDPGMTRVEEAAVDDHLAEDRRAARSGDTVAFHHEFDQAEALALSEGKDLFIDFETEWCGPCHVMDEWVYTADVVVAASSPYVSVKVDGDEHPELTERFLVEGYPTVLVVGPDGTVKRRTAGYQSVAEMVEFLSVAKDGVTERE